MNPFRALADAFTVYDDAAVQDALSATVAKSEPGPATPGFEEFERRGLEGAFNTANRGRVFAFFAIAVFTAWMIFADPAWWRRLTLCLMVALRVWMDVSTRRRLKRRGVELSIVRMSILGSGLFQIAIVFMSGGLLSPMLPVLLPAAFGAGLLADRWGVRTTVLGLQVPALAIMVLLHWTDVLPDFIPAPFRDGGDPSMFRIVPLAVVMGGLSVVFALFGMRLRQEARANLEQLQSAQEAALAAHRQRADDLTMMSGEIAHELKNPLASVKGLSQLLSRTADTADEKTTERLGVLEREVGRMQAILEEFLNFSRPLTPLTRAPVNLRAVCAEVATLHEGSIAAADVSLRVDMAPDIMVQGDARKIGQVLINLLQNALEVAPESSEIWFRAESTTEGTTLEVEDSGPGLDASVHGSLFEPGFTTKADGNGLGLTIARAIAEQHEGRLSLHNHPDGGCVARLFLPHLPEEAS